MRFVDIGLSICIDDYMETEEIEDMINHSMSLILRQDGVTGVGYDDWIERKVENKK